MSLVNVQTTPGFKVGFAWKGSSQHKNDRNRSTSLKQWVPLLTIPGVEWHCLQLEMTDAERLVLAQLPSVRIVAGIKDWADTATVMSTLDAVIAVDTGLVHLSGALGLPTCVFISANPDFRWLLAPRTDTPWYKSMRLYRQPKHGDWQTPFSEVAARLRAIVHDYEQRAA